MVGASRRQPDPAHVSGSVVSTLAYDDDSRLQSVTTNSLTTTYGYDEASNLLTTTLPSGNGDLESCFCDRAGRLSEVFKRRARRRCRTQDSAVFVVVPFGGNEAVADQGVGRCRSCSWGVGSVVADACCIVR